MTTSGPERENGDEPRPKGTVRRAGSKNGVAVASLVVSIVVALGSWQQIWQGVTALTKTPLARWAFVVLIGVMLLAVSVAFVVALFAVVRELRRRVDSSRRLRDELQATAVLHREVLMVLASSVSDGSKVREALARARKGIQERGISLDEFSSAHDVLKEFDQRLAVDDMEAFRRALREYSEASRTIASIAARQQKMREAPKSRNDGTSGLHQEKPFHRSSWWKWF